MQTETTASVPSLQYLKGVGPKKVQIFKKIGIETVRDLLYLFPRRYEDRSAMKPIGEIQPGETTTIAGTILAVKLKRMGRLQIVEISLGDDSGFIKGLWFNQGYLKKIFKEGQQVILYGRIELYKNQLQINSPEFEISTSEETETSHTGRITPIYPLTEGLFQKSLRTTLYEALKTHASSAINEHLPDSILQSHDLIGLRQAIGEMHFPTSFEEQEKARRRLVFDELFIFETILLRRIQSLKTRYKSYRMNNNQAALEKFSAALPFEMTGAQKRACEDILESFRETHPMNRLLQGDVGSGKTLVASFALFLAATNNLQGAFLVPTEILAEQHLKSLNKFLKPLNVSVALLTSSTPKKKKEKTLGLLKEGKISILVGTHSLLNESVEFKNLAVVTVDEQHKFGVHQRSKLLAGTPRPHQLVMTATPIPRTLALTIYGDLDLSLIEELPKGREPIKTYWIARKKQTDILNHIRKKIEAGEQAYFVFPLIEETEKMDLRAAVQEFEKLESGAFSGISMGLIHGKTDAEEREHIMAEFMQGNMKILVSTTVIEVGVDNPNATVMVVENAERFGLSQLHQLRGRIGRGSKASECFLFGEPSSVEGRKRLRIMTKTNDGFVIAEEDLKIRGPGDFLGTRQSGVPIFQLANPVLDMPILKEARRLAKNLTDSNQIMTDPLWLKFREHLKMLNIKY